MARLSRLLEVFRVRSRATRVVVIYVGDFVWGIFSSHKEAARALKLWSLSKEFGAWSATYELDWRNKKTPPPKYLSDTVTIANSTSPNSTPHAPRLPKSIPGADLDTYD